MYRYQIRTIAFVDLLTSWESKEQFYFRHRIRAYLVLLKTDIYQQFFSIKALTIAFTTFADEPWLAQLRNRKRAELSATNKPKTLGAAFQFCEPLAATGAAAGMAGTALVHPIHRR